eukprot:TRINITY_DN6544_c0_g1_i1.p1 TRINITY_DN6544_c0_g1~~TRINITY_DN6544_c0_g1_i1.p1  ORF type:complete len:327 (-),score=53.79 TRINITY_DN6544_c0_g1_i1:14-994(-)
MSATQKMSVPKVAIVGSGIVGRSWALVFARSGYEVRLFDQSPEVLQSALAWIEKVAQELSEVGLLRTSKSAEEVRSRVQSFATLKGAVEGVIWIQECVPEVLELKKKAWEEIDAVVNNANIVLASSTSAIPSSSFTSTLRNKNQCLVAHPVNPPHLIPLVELVPAPYTLEEVVLKARSIMEDVGQSPIIVKKEIDSFILNRLQGAVLNEAFKLVQDGYISPEDLDRTVKDGLGLRWSFMGPFETIDLNAPGGVRDYVARYGPNFHLLAQQQSEVRKWEGPVVETITEARRSVIPVDQLPERSKWRDWRLMGLMAHKAQMERTEPKK